MKTIFLAAVLTAAVALAGGRHGGGGGGTGGHVQGGGNFGPWRVPNQVNPTYLNPYAGNPYAPRVNVGYNPYYGAYWYTVPYTLDEMPAVNKPRERPAPVEPVIFEAPQRQEPQVVVVQPEPAPPPVVVVQQPAPAPAPAPAVQPAAAPEPAPPPAVEQKPHTPGPDVYLWVDEDGVTHYSTNVPDQYKAKAKKLSSLRE